MHCWRHKTPIIYRATTQWFAGMDDVPGCDGGKPAGALRETALRGIEATQFFPAWGKARLYGMIANRPDWTLSRQRQWGVPMPFFVDHETDELHPDTLALLELPPRKGRAGRHRSVVRRRRARTSASTRRNTASSPTRSTSGSIRARRTRRYGRRDGSHARARSSDGFPADLYLEGSDQHRGWFHSSLLDVVHAERRAAVQGAADARLRRRWRRPQDVEVEGQRRRAAEGCRTRSARRSCGCGSAATDYSGELSISDEILKRVVESYRRIRNTLRFLLANTADFDAATRRGAARRTARDRSLRARAGARRWPTRAPAITRATNSTGGPAAADVSAPRTSAASISTC